MQSTYEKGCDEVTDESGAIDICAHCASEDKLQPGLYYCFRCGSFGRYMCGDCNKKHRKYAHGHEVKSISDAAHQKKQNIYSFERGCDASKDDSAAADICAHCASYSNIQLAVYFCFHCGPFGRYMCEDCNKYHMKFANAHEVRSLLKEALPTREIPIIPPTPRQRPVSAVRTKTKVDMKQLVTKSVETWESIRVSGRTGNAVGSQARTPSKTEKVISSYSVNDEKTMPVVQRDQGLSPYKQRNISNVTETRKLDSNVEKQQVMKMKIQAADKETDLVEMRKSPMIPSKPRKRPVAVMWTESMVDMMIRDSGRTDNAVDSQSTTTFTTEKERSSYSVKDLKTMPVVQRDQVIPPYKQWNNSNITETRKHDSNVEKVEQRVMKMEIQAAEKETDIVNRSELNDRFCIVAAIDIGTKNSGYAYSTVDSFKQDPLKIYTRQWIGENSVLLNDKTCVLFDKNKKFHSFGFDAENKYRELACDGEHRDYYFFRRFKRKLFDKMQPKRKLMLEDETGKSMDAMDVFSACIKYLREHLMDLLKEFPYNDIRWVLTFPGFCNKASKDFMRESAQKAGIHKERLLIVTEPEAAITFARNLPVKCSTEPDDRFKPFAAKSDYLGVLDAGGDTIKITIYEVKGNRAVRELYKTSVLNLGSTNIDMAFRDFLADIVGNDIMDDFQQNNMLDYNDMFKKFELKRRWFQNDMTEKISLHVPLSLIEKIEEANEKRIKNHLMTKPEYNGKVYWVRYTLRIDPNIVKGMFQETFDKIASHLKSLFSKPEFKDVQNILMVGAFSESLSLQDFIIKTFPNKRIIIPQDASLSVLKGAVILGHIW